MKPDAETANNIVKLVTGREAHDALGTVAVALIHICHYFGISKAHMLRSMSMQWDIYEKNQTEMERSKP